MRERSETIPEGSRETETVRSLYVLKDPITKEIRYVGSTTNPSRRFIQHLSEAKCDSTAKGKKTIWLRNLLRHNRKPLLEVLMTSTDTAEIMRLENWMILRSRLNLLNHIDHAISSKVLTNLVHMYDLDGIYLDTFCNATQASKAMGIHDSSILRCCKREFGVKSAGGYQWSFKRNTNIEKVERNDSSKKVYCVEKGCYFKSAREAERETGVSYKRISACLNGRQETAGGFHWKR